MVGSSFIVINDYVCVIDHCDVAREHLVCGEWSRQVEFVHQMKGLVVMDNRYRNNEYGLSNSIIGITMTMLLKDLYPITIEIIHIYYWLNTLPDKS